MSNQRLTHQDVIGRTKNLEYCKFELFWIYLIQTVFTILCNFWASHSRKKSSLLHYNSRFINKLASLLLLQIKTNWKLFVVIVVKQVYTEDDYNLQRQWKTFRNFNTVNTTTKIYFTESNLSTRMTINCVFTIIIFYLK